MKTGIFDVVKERYATKLQEEISLKDYLDLCKKDSSVYSTAAERLLKAIGEPEVIDTSKDHRLSRIFCNKIIKRYKTFSDFHGMEEAIEQIVSFLKHSAQGLEEENQILYLLGPVGGGKSSLAEKLKQLMEKEPIYALKDSPVFESPLGLFSAEDAETLEKEYGIDPRYVKVTPSPWAVKRLHEYNGDITKFKVVKLYPSISDQVGIAKTEPGDENNQDISTLVGKVDIRKLEQYSQNDPDAYSFSGGLCRANQGILDFVEMFKAPIKILHPLLTATQEGNYNATEGLSSIPFRGLILAHSNEAEWDTFRNNKNNEAFLDRISIVKVPYCLKLTEEVEIYKKLLKNSSLHTAPCAPNTLKMLAEFSILSRLYISSNDKTDAIARMLVYDGQNLKDQDPDVKSITEYKELGGVNEGMSGLSTRFAFKILSKVFNFDTTEVAANPVHLLYVLEKQVIQEQLPEDVEETYITIIKSWLGQEYIKFLGQEIQTAYLESYAEYGQDLFNKYIKFADYWIQDQDYRDPDTGEILSRADLNSELEKIEKTAGITNPKDYRHEVVNYVLRAKANNKGKNPDWKSYAKLKHVIEQNMFANTEDLLPIISFTAKKSSKDKQAHDDFVQRMVARGYTEKQVKLLCEWYLRVRKAS